MSSWTTLHAILGISVDYGNKTLTLNPKEKNIKIPLCLPNILAEIVVFDGELEIKCLKGSFDGWIINSRNCKVR